ncbi:cation transporter [Kordiimonas laminariae]|uniref:cation transporter n=1 Tax=Kordiimonas laminariae TaxID=2917717 RepID=UPI001FF1BDC9|nr:cation diffusion facilitator family transporter [Kordiimonas laminariae]MCK0071227.1 cation diffusion facilitator family transporter [Kordiimonas laminariae]
MSGSCGCGSDQNFDGSSLAYKRVLIVIIAINFGMFFVEFFGGLASGSMSLLADSLDFLGDSATYTISLIVIGMPLAVRAKASLFKSLSLFAIAAWVLGSTLYRVFIEGVPEALIMGTIGVAAFAANVISALLLLKYKDGDSNVRSVWLCSRNDAIGNLTVIVAASGIAATDAAWPDLVVAGIMGSLFIHSATRIVQQSWRELIEEKQRKVNSNGGVA